MGRGIVRQRRNQAGGGAGVVWGLGNDDSIRDLSALMLNDAYKDVNVILKRIHRELIILL